MHVDFSYVAAPLAVKGGIDLGDLDDLNVGANQRGSPSRLEVDCFHFAVRPSFRWCTLPFLPVE
jgi:hypothetical protein